MVKAYDFNKINDLWLTSDSGASASRIAWSHTRPTPTAGPCGNAERSPLLTPARRSPTSTATSPGRHPRFRPREPIGHQRDHILIRASECRSTPIAQYAITRAGKDRGLSSVQSQPTITSSTISGGTPASIAQQIPDTTNKSPFLVPITQHTFYPKLHPHATPTERDGASMAQYQHLSV